jgi:DNA-binding response OmpR family regulator
MATKIIVANNDTAFLHLMEDLLSEEGYDVTVVAASDQAYDLIRKDKPALVILDIGMERPGNGWTLLSLLRLDPEMASIPIIVSSVDSKFLKEKDATLRAQRCDILEKPFALEKLLTKVRVALGT